MAFKDGIFSRLFSWQSQDAEGFNIDPAKLDQDADDIAAGLTLALLRDGSSKPAADLPMAGFGLTGMRAGKAPGEAVTFEQLADVGGGGLPTGVVAVSTWPTLITADTHLSKLLFLTGSGTLNGPASPTKGAFLYVSKSDKSGIVTFVPSAGKVDGLTSLNIYQERFGLWFDGTNWWSIGRQRGWVNINNIVVSTAVASLTFNTGFADAEFQEMAIDLDGMSLSNNGAVFGRVIKGGSVLTTGYVQSGLEMVNTNSITGTGSPATGPSYLIAAPQSAETNPTAPYGISVSIANPSSATANLQRTKFQHGVGVNGTGFGLGRGFQTTPGAITGFVVTPQVGYITGAVCNQKGFRA